MKLSQVPELYQKILIAAGFGAILGGTFGGVLAPTYSAIALGSLGGWICGALTAYLVGHRLAIRQFLRADRAANVFFTALGLALSVAGVIGFIKTGRWIGLFAAAFFGLGAAYLLVRARQD